MKTNDIDLTIAQIIQKHKELDYEIYAVYVELELRRINNGN